MPAILRGEDVVLAAETGSGKTLAYVAPLADLALRSRQAQAAAAAAEAGGEAGGEQDAWAGHARRHRATAALVLCPNGALCDQVLAAAAEALRDPGGGPPLAAAALVSAQCPPPAALPDIVVATPGGLLSLLDNSGAAYGHEWTRAGVVGWAGAVTPSSIFEPGPESKLGSAQPPGVTAAMAHPCNRVSCLPCFPTPVQACPAGRGPWCLTRPTCCWRGATGRRCASCGTRCGAATACTPRAACAPRRVPDCGRGQVLVAGVAAAAQTALLCCFLCSCGQETDALPRLLLSPAPTFTMSPF